MLIAARCVQGFIVLCLILMAQVADRDFQSGSHHAASVVILSAMLLVLLAVATVAARSFLPKHKR